MIGRIVGSRPCRPDLHHPDRQVSHSSSKHVTMTRSTSSNGSTF